MGCGEGFPKWKGDVVREDQRSSTCASFTSIDVYEVGSSSSFSHMSRELCPKICSTDSGLDAHWQSSDLCYFLDKLHKAGDIGKS
tara:strand:- start:490 stop:744 length:255 start_codon:yes stop_codon:yes gene_type:complete